MATVVGLLVVTMHLAPTDQNYRACSTSRCATTQPSSPIRTNSKSPSNAWNHCKRTWNGSSPTSGVPHRKRFPSPSLSRQQQRSRDVPTAPSTTKNSTPSSSAPSPSASTNSSSKPIHPIPPASPPQRSSASPSSYLHARTKTANSCEWATMSTMSTLIPA